MRPTPARIGAHEHAAARKMLASNVDTIIRVLRNCDELLFCIFRGNEWLQFQHDPYLGETPGLDGMRAFNVALLDFDGTLVDTRGAVVECIRSILREHSWRERPETDISQVIATGAPRFEALQRLMPDLESGQVQECVRRYRVRYPAFDNRAATIPRAPPDQRIIGPQLKIVASLSRTSPDGEQIAASRIATRR
jgi:hypothetical protein